MFTASVSAVTSASVTEVGRENSATEVRQPSYVRKELDTQFTHSVVMWHFLMPNKSDLAFFQSGLAQLTVKVILWQIIIGL